jgi:hypothetical protein
MDAMEPAHDEPPAHLRTLLPRPWAVWFWSHARKWVVGVIGSTVLLLGVVMLVVPGPGWLTIFAGLALLATEFAWARWMLKHAQARLKDLVDAAKNGVGLGAAKETPPQDSAGQPTQSVRGARP